MTEIALIGDADNAEFSPLVAWLREDFESSLNGVWPDISSWEQGQSAGTDVPLTVVLQSWSDEYRPEDVERLIGATLYSGLFCCYGSWCEGDGRTHAIWPHSTRVPVRYAREVLQAELQRIEVGQAVMPPTAARDEVFLRRQSAAEALPQRRQRTALVISPDRVYRTTLGQALESSGWCAESAALGPGSLQSVTTPQLVVHDLDPDVASVTDSIAACRARFPDTPICGVASMPGECHQTADEIPVVPRLDPATAVTQIEELRRDVL